MAASGPSSPPVCQRRPAPGAVPCLYKPKGVDSSLHCPCMCGGCNPWLHTGNQLDVLGGLSCGVRVAGISTPLLEGSNGLVASNGSSKW